MITHDIQSDGSAQDWNVVPQKRSGRAASPQVTPLMQKAIQCVKTAVRYLRRTESQCAAQKDKHTEY
jgi:hypothetical protein